MFRKILFPLSLIAVVTIGLYSCNDNDSAQSTGAELVYVAPAPDYNDSLMWHIDMNDEEGRGADVFYIPSTWEFDWHTADGIISHHAAPTRAEHRANMEIEMSKVAEYMADGNNFYSPHYRHITLDSWATLNEDTINRRYHDVAFVDVKHAFSHYLNHFNNGRPFILAGFSQGAKSVVELMKTLSEDVRSRMIAAYVLGYKVTPNDVRQAPWITAAKDSLDTGVTICYNSVSDVKHIKPLVNTPCVMSINPVNWRTDATPAILHDTITVTLSPEHHALVLKGFDGSYLPNILDILNVGDYHGIEPWLYSECLRKNIKQRIRSFKKG